jgi:ketosteroid isomerase-like protein
MLVCSFSGSIARAQRVESSRAAPTANGPLADSLRIFALDMAALLRARNTDAVIRLYGDTARFVHIENGDIIPWSRLSAMMRQYFATVKENPVSAVGEPGVLVIDRNTAVVWVVHRMGATDRGPAHEGTWSGVLRRIDGAWRIVHSHSSDRRSRS